MPILRMRFEAGMTDERCPPQSLKNAWPHANRAIRPRNSRSVRPRRRQRAMTTTSTIDRDASNRPPSGPVGNRSF